MDIFEPRGIALRVLRPLAGWPTSGSVLRDVLLGALVAGLCLVEVVLRWTAADMAAAEAVLTAVAAVGVTALAVVLSRPYPLLSLVVAMLASFWVYGLGILLICAAYLVGRRMPSVWPAVTLFGAGSTIWLVLMPVVWPDDPVAWTTVVSALVFSAVLPWLVGVHRRQRIALTTAGWAHARQLQREYRLTAEQARLRERSRIAQDMHDSLGHELSLIALRAGALEVTPGLDEEHRRSAAELRATAVTATQHLREIIGVLRTDAEPAPTSPADEGVSALVDRARDSGMRVCLVRGEDTEGLPPMVDRAVYRVVQESLTNATKYAPGAEVAVWITAGGGRLEVRVVNSAPSGALPVAGEGGRRGLIGLGERVRLVGGSFAARADGAGGWEVCAAMPLDGAVDVGAGEEDGEATAINQLQLTARRRVRAWTLALVLMPVIVIAVGASAMGWIGSVLAPEEFASLAAGDRQADVEEVLPEASLYVDAQMLEESAVPEGARCSYYRSDARFFGGETVLYQLCFADGRLLTKGKAPLR